MDKLENWVWAPFLIGVPFTAVITGAFTLSDSLPLPLSIPIGVVWGVVLGIAAAWLQTKPKAAAWVEDILVAAGIFAVAFAACGGVMGLRMLDGALTSSTLSGETLEAMFWPMIPYYIAVNAPMELLIVPLLVFLCWRPGCRRILILCAAVLYFGLRVWTYVAFAPARLGFTEGDHGAAAMSSVARAQAYTDLKLDDPRWILLLVILGVLVAAAGFPRSREVYPALAVTSR